MIEIDGSAGGGQLLRTALSLSMVTATPFTMTGIRAKRSRPGLMRQHLTAIDAARQVSDAAVLGAEPGSQMLTFIPQAIRAGDYHFPIGTAGSTTLVLQTVLPALIRAHKGSSIRLEGGTHNPLAPPADFLIDAFAPVLAKMGVQTDIRLDRHGFYPAGGGVIDVNIQPAQVLKPLQLIERGQLRAVSAKALVSSISSSVAERELKIVARRLSLSDSAMRLQQIKPPIGPGNALIIRVESEHITECFTAFGERGVSAEQVAERVCEEVQRYIKADVAVGAQMADQLLLPFALAGGGSFTTTAPTDHSRTNASLIEKFLPVNIDFVELRPATWKVEVG
ncbi:RNA 3'-terminal phosphate cyclase [Dyella caseinilytica]|uniref:RNA 3'-terminal phosphate cyclase n=1 Tax=Dyella caseinilytica TaxID=1849581 RepID=A0ABX7GSJ7_9GAMM|nr:RNA 3'-terminal phosphate cyclase [Dyella caseinilytica]QRN53361.1 RNA 3'-terminal phosphate cyclase [Dyella caseinilytica]GFZ85913.1 RNA 3'-terminal phosphate cyclase [Dyella caseinilytica]